MHKQLFEYILRQLYTPKNIYFNKLNNYFIYLFLKPIPLKEYLSFIFNLNEYALKTHVE